LRVAIAGLALILAAPAAAQQPPAATPAPERIVVSAHPLDGFAPRDRTRVRFGQLAFRSGLILTSPHRGFGGVSAIRLDARGERFVAVTDKGDWLLGRIVYAGRQMTGLADVDLAPMLGADGRAMARRGWYDAEALALAGGVAYVGLERVNRVLRFDLGKGGATARAEEVAAPPALRKLPNNKGVEALVLVPKGLPLEGALIALSERGLDANGDIQGFLIGGPAPGAFSIRRTRDYDSSDAALLPSGDLLVLERKFSLFGGAGIRIRRIALRTIAPGATVDGPSIFDADLGQEIDNFEGLEAHRDAAGDTVLTLVSDDNFSMLQRTLLLQFTLIEE
jgi:hypothetical protein